MTVLEHDPERGCQRCPISKHDATLLRHIAQDERRPAPAWCPLRSGPVTVRVPSKASP